MNKAALAHHTAITDWCIRTKLRQDPNRSGTPTLKCKLTAEKYDLVSRWCAEVNALFVQPVKKENPTFFRRCRFSAAMLAPNKPTTPRSSCKTASMCCNSNTLAAEASGSQKMIIQGALRSGRPTKDLAKSAPSPGEHEQSICVLLSNDARYPTIVSKMDNTSKFYEEERRMVHLKIQPEGRRKVSGGWTVNRPMLYSVGPPSSHLLSGGTKPKVIESPVDSPPQSDATCSGDDAVSISSGPSAEDASMHNNITTDHVCSGELHSKSEKWVEIGRREDSKWTSQTTNLTLLDRSTSNCILNVLSVDDCKMTMRYRPTRVILTQKCMIASEPLQATVTGAEEQQADPDLNDSSEQLTTVNQTPIRLSKASGQTTLSPSTLPPQASYCHMYEGLASPEDDTRPSSAAVERAFNALLDKTFSSRCAERPHTSRQHNNLRRMRLVSHAPSRQFRQLNTFLRKTMCQLMDSRRCDTRLKL